MDHICDICHFPFFESPIQFYHRSKKNLKKTCTDCLRISKAEERAEMREIKKNKTEEENTFDKALYLKKLYGRVTPALLQRKFKLNYERATKLSLEINKESHGQENKET